MSSTALLLVMQQLAACEGRRAGAYGVLEREDAHADGLEDPQAPGSRCETHIHALYNCEIMCHIIIYIYMLYI